jgi:N-acylneuraminate cytidylyltransferase
MKNIKPIAGKPLVYWAVKAACECEEIDKVFVSTDSDMIASAVKGFGFAKVEVVGRSAESATDTASTESAMLEFAENHHFDKIALIQATSPLITADDLTKGFLLLSQGDADSVLSVVRQKRFLWEDSKGGYAFPQNYDYFHRPRRQEFDGFLVENGAFYITARSSLLQSQCRLSGKIKTVEMLPESYIEIDEPEDWLTVEHLLQRRQKAHIIPEIKMFLTDCDGTLTDGGMYYSAEGEVMKKFNTRDGAGLHVLKERGIITGIVTGEVSSSVLKRAEKLEVDELLMGIGDKKAVISRLCNKYGVDAASVAYIGDDLNDVEAISFVGFGICVSDGCPEAKTAADYVTNARGGEGAVREAADLILKANKA